MAQPYLSELINTADVFDAAFAQPGMRISPRSKKRPTLEQATKAVMVETERAVAAYVTETIAPSLQEAYDDHLALYGARDAADNKGEWDNAVDEEVVEPAIEQFVPDLSADWLGKNTIDAGIHLEDGITKFCVSLGKEYFKQLTYGKTPAQILSNAGITSAHIEARLTIHSNPTPEEKDAMANQTDNDLQAVYQKIAEHIGKDHDTMTVYEDLELAIDDDDGLAFGAGARLGADESDVETLRMVALEHGADAVDVIQQAIQAVLDGGKAKKKAPVKKAKTAAVEEDEEDTSFLDEADDKPASPTKAPKAEKPVKKVKANVDAIDASVLLTIKDCGAGDTETAKALGISRQTYTNAYNGKSEFSPTDTQYQHLRDVIVSKINALHEALASIDGTEAEVVF